MVHAFEARDGKCVSMAPMFQTWNVEHGTRTKSGESMHNIHASPPSVEDPRRKWQMGERGKIWGCNGRIEKSYGRSSEKSFQNGKNLSHQYFKKKLVQRFHSQAGRGRENYRYGPYLHKARTENRYSFNRDLWGQAEERAETTFHLLFSPRVKMFQGKEKSSFSPSG